jgi:hypothetical protein
VLEICDCAKLHARAKVVTATKLVHSLVNIVDYL